MAATHLEGGRLVALKLLVQGTFNANAEERFLREARATVQIQGLHVAKVLDVGRLDDGAPYLAMEHLVGRDLGAKLEACGRLPAALAIDYVLQACEAVAEAHALGIVHRDLKPANLFLARRDGATPVIKVLDFGIAKTRDHGDDDVSLTVPDSVLGSPLYMPPEQIRNARSVDARGDIWSLGVVLYELVTGHTPFRAESVAGVLGAIMAEPPLPLSDSGAVVPEALETVILRCLEKDREDRYPTVTDLAAALARARQVWTKRPAT